MELANLLWNRTKNSDHQNLKKIVLLHGMGGTGKLWRPIAAGLEDEMAVLALDQRGHGGSQVVDPLQKSEGVDYTPLAYGQDVLDTLARIGFHPTWVLGHSMGVRTAVAAAYLRPDWFQGLILVDLGFSGAAGGGLGEDLAGFLAVLPTQFESRAAAREFMKIHCPDPSIAQYLMAVSEQSPSDGSITFPFDHQALIQTIHSAKESTLRGWLQDLAERQLPILVLRGARSLVWSQNEFEQERQHFQGLATIEFKEIPGAGHGLPFEQRQTMIQLIREWINR
jgi:esterase